jgi:predicted metal-dependent enzyme (double-stranded beta helix superfamily)
MFDKDRFIEDCRVALRTERDARGAIRALVASAVSSPPEVLKSLGEPHRSGVEVLYRGTDLTILNLSWGPLMQVRPHDHRMWAVIGIYGGREQNRFFLRSENGLAQHSARELDVKEVAALGEQTIHAVTNPLDSITSAIHVYGGDFFDTPRSEWDPTTLEERAYDVANTMREFEAANARLTRGAKSP